MLKIKILLALMSILIFGLGQVNVASIKQNFVYMGFENPLQVNVNGYDCNNLTIKTKDGEVLKQGNCKHLFIPNIVGLCKLLIYHNDMLIDSTYVRSMLIPEDIYKPTIDGREGQLYPRVMSRVIVLVKGLGFEAKAKVQSYKIMFCVDDTLVQLINQGELLGEEFKKYEKRFTDQTTVIIYDINIKPLSGHFLTLNDIMSLSYGSPAYISYNECVQGIRCNENKYYSFETEGNIEKHYLYKRETVDENIFTKYYNTDSIIIEHNNGIVEIFEIDSEKYYDGNYWKYDNEVLMIKGAYTSEVLWHDTTSRINPITLQYEEYAVPIKKSNRSGKWFYYDINGAIIKEEEYD